MNDITDVLAQGFNYLETKYDVEFDEIDSWESEEAYDFVSNLLDENPDDEKLVDLLNNLESISTEDFVLAVEKYSEL
jgi:hypothetical protein